MSTKPGADQLAEGFCSSCIVFESTKKATLCCRNAGNLIKVARALKQINPKIKIHIIADDDKYKLEQRKQKAIKEGKKVPEKNAGLDAAIQIGILFNASISCPDYSVIGSDEEFLQSEKPPSDFHDIFFQLFQRGWTREESLNEVLKQINKNVKQFEAISFIEIKENILGLDINALISLKNGAIVSLAEALQDHCGEYCVCPISGEKAVINFDNIYSFKEKKVIIPILKKFHDQSIINEVKTYASLRNRLKWIKKNSTQNYIYAVVYLSSYRLGADIPSKNFNDWLRAKIDIQACDEILYFIKFLSDLKINYAKKLTKLDTTEFKTHLHLNQKDGLLDWQPAIRMAKSNQYKLIAIKAQHGQGKTKTFIKTMFHKAKSDGGGVIIAHRAKLITQIADELGCTHYSDDRKVINLFGIVPNLACCLHSFKHNKYLEHLEKARDIFIDEASQVLKSFFTDRNIDVELFSKFSESAKGSIVYLLDADLTTQDIQHYQEILYVSDNEVLVITAEPPVRDFTCKLWYSAASAYYKTPIINAIKNDLKNNIPIILAVESEVTARAIYKFLNKDFPHKRIKLLTGKMPVGESQPFINNIIIEMTSIDLLIHTSCIGSGVSIQHDDKRFQKGYGLFSGTTLSATECLQMMRRCRDITYWEIGLLCKPAEMVMTSFHKNIGAIALKKAGIKQNKLETETKLNVLRNRCLFTHAFVGLLHEYNIRIIDTISDSYKIDGLIPDSQIRKEDVQELINAIPLTLDQAMKARKKGYQDHSERIRSEAAICMNHFKINEVTSTASTLWCVPKEYEAARKMERIINILRSEENITDVQKKSEILTRAGITLNLFRRQKLTKNDIKILRDCIACQCSELVGLELLPERYAKESKIPSDRPINFLIEVLKCWGFKVKTKRYGRIKRENQLCIDVPPPLVSRLNIDSRSDDDRVKDEAIKLRCQGIGYGSIAKKLGITKEKARQFVSQAGVLKSPSTVDYSIYKRPYRVTFTPLFSLEGTTKETITALKEGSNMNSIHKQLAS